MSTSKQRISALTSPDVTTLCECPDCGATTRIGRHLDIDCDTVKDLQAQLTEARALVKRHEAALEWLSVTQDYDSLHKNHKIQMYALCKLGELGRDNGISTAMTTPLAAIEAAMQATKDEK